MCHSTNNKLQSRLSNPCNGYVTGAPANGYFRTSDVQNQLNTGDRVTTEKIEIFRGVSYYVIHEGQANSPFVILKKVN